MILSTFRKGSNNLMENRNMLLDTSSRSWMLVYALAN